jgi:hypothetical protein
MEAGKLSFLVKKTRIPINRIAINRIAKPKMSIFIIMMFFDAAKIL